MAQEVPLAQLSKIAVCAENNVNIESNSVSLAFLNSAIHIHFEVIDGLCESKQLKFCFPTPGWKSSFSVSSTLMMNEDQFLHLRGLQLSPRLLARVLILHSYSKFIGQKYKMSEKLDSTLDLNAIFMSKNR